MARQLFHILGKRSFLTFGLVAFLVGGLLASIHLTSRYALKQYVEYQLSRIPWDIALYQKGPSGGNDTLRSFVASRPGIAQVAELAFMRARFPEGGEVQPRVDGTPFNTPWLSVLAASDLSLLPPQLKFALSRSGSDRGAVLALVGPEIAIGKSFLGLQGTRRFALEVTTLGVTRTVFETPVRQVVRLDRDELNRWLMDQTGSVSYVPAIGAILLMPFDWDVITAFDFVANGIVPDADSSVSGDELHVQKAEYAPELVYLARIDRSRLVSGWDLPRSLANVSALAASLHADARENAPMATPGEEDESHHGGEEDAGEGEHPEKFSGTSYVVDSTTEVLLGRMAAIARTVTLLSVLIALPMLWMAWVLGANLTGLLMLNERRTLGLLRLRGVPSALIGRVLTGSVAAAGAAGGLLGLASGAVLTLLVYEGGALPFDVLANGEQLLAFGGFLIVTVAMALLVCRRFVRYATTIAPVEATRRVSGGDTRTIGGGRLGPALALGAGTYVLVSWMVGASIGDRLGSGWIASAEQAAGFIGLPLFVFGLATLLARASGGGHGVMQPALRAIGGVLGGFAARHVGSKPHRTAAFLLIVALMSSVTLYPLVTSGSFEDKAARGARVQLGADWQVLYNTPDLVDASALSGPASEQLPAIAAAAESLLTALRGVEGVTAATYLVETLLPNFYLPGYGLRGVPLYLVADTAAYGQHAYTEPPLGVTADFGTLLGGMARGEVAVSQPVADFWQLAPGKPAVVGLDRARQAVATPMTGILAFLPGLPPKTVSDRQGFVQARVDYLNYLLGTNAYLASGASAPSLAPLQMLAPRLVVLLRTAPGRDQAALRAAIAGATGVQPLELHSLEEEVQKVGSDMFISLALANMRIYLIGGALLALVAILAIAFANYVEDRRTLALLRIRGASPRTMWRFLLATLLAPASVGLVIGALAAGMAGFGLANHVWQLRAVRSIVQLLPTHLVLPPQVAGVVGLLLAFLVAVATGFSWWAFRQTALKGSRAS